jgi:hypothetical protein
MVGVTVIDLAVDLLSWIVGRLDGVHTAQAVTARDPD